MRQIPVIINIVLLLMIVHMHFGCADTDSAKDKRTERENFHLFILAGQSNMAGRGTVQSQDKEEPARVFKLNRKGQWVPATDPVHYDKPVAGVGPGRSFGVALAGYDTTISVGLIPCAVGGSSITAWKPGGFHEQTQTHPYDDCIDRVRTARKDGVLKAILWHQGASDSNPKQAPKYKDRLYEFVKHFRSELNAPEVPFIAGQQGHFEERPWDQWRKMVDSANASLPSSLSHTAFVSSEGLTHKGDSLHFDSESARELGRRYAKAYIRLEKEK